MRRLALLTVWAAIAALAQPSASKSRVDGIFARYNSRTSPGCAVGVSVKGDTVLSAAYGMADLEHDVALTPETVFEPGSVTKQFTAAAVFLLAQQGKLSIDDPVRKYIPELPDYGAPLTIRHLINHTSGLRDWGSIAAIGGWPRGARAHTHDHMLEIAARQKALNYTPGAEYSYTNTGYNLAAVLVGHVAGKSLAEFTKEAIFTPLGMTSTQWRDDYRRIVRNRAIAYSGSGSEFRLNMPFEFVHGNGGLLTTIGDLLRWNRNFTHKKVGGQALYDAQHQRARLNDGSTIAYAGGLNVLHWRGFNEVSHSGSTAGYSAWLGRYPDQDVAVAVMCNLAVNATQLGHAVAEVYLPAGSAETPAPVKGDASRAGMYRSMRDRSVITVVHENGELRIQNRAPIVEFDGPRMRFVSEANNTIYEKVEPWTPASADLDTFAGDYVSDEAQVTYTVAVEGDRLVIRVRPAARFNLTATYRDAFSSPIGSVRFLRDASGKVTDLSFGESRVWDLRFRKVR
jgi:CubicO group peptidase (beta-lactamase class C family)